MSKMSKQCQTLEEKGFFFFFDKNHYLLKNTNENKDLKHFFNGIYDFCRILYNFCDVLRNLLKF